MKQFSRLSLKVLGLILFTGSGASAACFEFTSGSPQNIGNIFFADKPTHICLQNVNAFLKDYIGVTFFDRQGELARFAAQEISRGRCPGTCKILELTSGNNNGNNVNPTGIRIEITDYRITIHAGRGFPQAFTIKRSENNK
jgi:hypothetical protein